jgi:hypothetical protein
MDFNDARAHVVALLIKCPYELNPAHCHLHDMRGKSLEDNMEISKRLTEQEVQHILAVHKKCLSRKEGKLLP